MKRLIAAVMVLAALTSCASKEQRTADEMKLAVAAKMKDPDSSTFTSLKVNAGMLCGNINSKNSFGAYAGPEQFIASGPNSVRFRSEVEVIDAMAGNDAARTHLADGFDRNWDLCQRAGVKVQ